MLEREREGERGGGDEEERDSFDPYFHILV